MKSGRKEELNVFLKSPPATKKWWGDKERQAEDIGRGRETNHETTAEYLALGSLSRRGFWNPWWNSSIVCSGTEPGIPRWPWGRRSWHCPSAPRYDDTVGAVAWPAPPASGTAPPPPGCPPTTSVPRLCGSQMFHEWVRWFSKYPSTPFTNKWMTYPCPGCQATSVIQEATWGEPYDSLYVRHVFVLTTGLTSVLDQIFF